MKKNREVICAFAAWVLSACFFMSCFMIPGLAEKITVWETVTCLYRNVSDPVLSALCSWNGNRTQA